MGWTTVERGALGHLKKGIEMDDHLQGVWKSCKIRKISRISFSPKVFFVEKQAKTCTRKPIFPAFNVSPDMWNSVIKDVLIWIKARMGQKNLKTWLLIFPLFYTYIAAVFLGQATQPFYASVIPSVKWVDEWDT